MQTRSARAMATRLQSLRATERAVRGQLDALSPLAVLDRGYSLTYSQTGELLRTSNAVARGDALMTRLANGVVISTVEETTDKS
jgi:exodeoxyribonuclease VII large subunit